MQQLVLKYCSKRFLKENTLSNSLMLHNSSEQYIFLTDYRFINTMKHKYTYQNVPTVLVF
jgi:hypothetical protein